MNNIRETLEKLGVKTLLTDTFIEYMIKHIPLGGTSYSLLRLLNKSLGDDTYSMPVYSRMIHSIESVMGAVIENYNNKKELHNFIEEVFKKEVSNNTKITLKEYLKYAANRISKNSNSKSGLSKKN